jgi:hypothetical protein
MLRDHETEEVLTHPGGASSTRKPRYGLIPPIALERLAERFELGEKKYGAKGTYNALAPRRAEMLTREWVTARLEHVIAHALHALQVLHGQAPDDDDDAGALMFGGAVLADYWDHQKKGAINAVQAAPSSGTCLSGLGNLLP